MNKTNFMAGILAVALTICLFSCGKKSNDELYSCNPKINSWAVANKARLQQYNRQQLAAVLSIDSQKAIYRTMSPTEQCAIWKEKLQWILDSSDFSSAEKGHIQIAYDYLQPIFYEDSISLATLATWGANWVNEGMTQLGWDSIRVFLIAETFMLPPELNSLREHIISTNGGNPQYLPGDDGNKPDCDCLNAVGCQWFVESCDKGGGCRKTDGGCGFWGSSNCSGGCKGGLMTSGSPRPYRY